MKLIQELLALREEAIETTTAADLWKENKDSAKTYIPTAVYMVKKVKDSDPTEYEVYSDTNGKRKQVATMDPEELEDAYVPVRPNQKEDAEGFTVYRDAQEVEAFKHTGDTTKVDLEGEAGALEGEEAEPTGETKTLKKGDYLIRQTEEDEFTYDVQSAKDFEDAYSEKK